MFENKVENLRKYFINLDKEEDLNREYTKKFFSLIEILTINMLDGEDNFFGYFLLKVRKELKLTITWPIATIPKENGFIMYYNPILFLENSKKEMIALLKHEIYHIMYGHYEREKNLILQYSRVAVNVALDISINQYIKNLPMNAETIEKVRKEYDILLKDNDTCENYARKINKKIKERLENNINKDKSTIAKEVDISRAHELWDGINMAKEQLNDIQKKTAISSFKEGGPDDIKKLISEFRKNSEIPWQRLLKSLIKEKSYGSKKTITRRNRRQPERLDLRGNLRSKNFEIIVAIDISASMSEEYYKKIMIELLNITDVQAKNILVIECDDKIRRIYKLKSKNDIEKRCKKTGATLFTPVFKYIEERNLKDSVLIYFTDGVGEEVIKSNIVNKNIIWAIIGNEELSISKKIGRIVRIKEE